MEKQTIRLGLLFAGGMVKGGNWRLPGEIRPGMALGAASLGSGWRG